MPIFQGVRSGADVQYMLEVLLPLRENCGCVCRLVLNVDTDDVIHMLKTDTSIEWMVQLNL